MSALADLFRATPKCGGYTFLILFQNLPAHFQAGLPDAGRVQDLGLAAEADDPAVKLGGFRHIHGENEVVLPVGEQHGAAAEPVHDHVDQALVEPHFHGD